MATHPAFAPIAPRHQRSRGEVLASWRLRKDQAQLRDFRQAGSARAIALPGPELVVISTSGGLTAGDRLTSARNLGDGCRVTAPTQTAERLYRASGGEPRFASPQQSGPSQGWIGCRRRPSCLKDSPQTAARGLTWPRMPPA